MLSVVATLRVGKDKIEEAKAFFKELVAEVRKNEPGTLEYVVHQRKDEPEAFVVYEKYESEEAFKIHGKNLAKLGARFGPLLAGRPEIVMLEEI